ncbi:hypothetical protein [Peloplasma aerotolerans]|uniref:Uncharacterized protein n=1 Tax=Peloplasma aerotolerans TaxID=3044389 RepID=A0AAW6U8P2_9MOLU|nr:hypothetical protein [Mariniplasma sp. M4Ah]MDI6453295.1 hypothetical protein [Mariniplasma sp. M4Ah]
MDKRIIYTILAILLFLGVTILVIMLRRFVPFDEEAVPYDFEAIEVNENLSVEELRNQNVKVLIQFLNDNEDDLLYSVYFYDYDVIRELYEDLLEIRTILTQINYGRISGLLITENDDNLTLTFSSLPRDRSIYKEYSVNVSKNFLYIIPYSGGMILQLDFAIQVFFMIGTFGVISESNDYYANPVSIQLYSLGTEENSRIFFSIRGDHFYTRESFCEYCISGTEYAGLDILNSKAYIIQ